MFRPKCSPKRNRWLQNLMTKSGSTESLLCTGGHSLYAMYRECGVSAEQLSIAWLQRVGRVRDKRWTTRLGQAHGGATSEGCVNAHSMFTRLLGMPRPNRSIPISGDLCRMTEEI